MACQLPLFQPFARLGRSRGASRRGARFRSAWPLAERMEALLRVVNDPAPFAKRLARRLRKAQALTQRIAASWAEHRDLVGQTLYDALATPITCAQAVFRDTSEAAPRRNLSDKSGIGRAYSAASACARPRSTLTNCEMPCSGMVTP